MSESSQGYGKTYVAYWAWQQELVRAAGTISDRATFE